MRKTIGAVALLILFIQSAEARYYDTLKMTCAQAKSALRQAGSLTMYTGPNVYNRYYASRGLQRAFVPTKDHRYCPIGFVSDATQMPDTDVIIRVAKPGCHVEGEAFIINYREMENNLHLRPIYHVCRNGQWVREDTNPQFAVSKGSGTSVIGTSLKRDD